MLSRKDLFYEGVLSTLFIRLPAYSVHSLAFLLKSGKDMPSATYDLFRQWMQSTGKGNVLKAEQELLQKQAFEQLQAELLALQELKNAKGEAIALGDEVLVDLLERFPYPGQLQTLLKKAGSAEKLSQLLDNLTPFAANKSQLYSIITKIPDGKVDDFLADVANSQFAKTIAENPTLMEAWKEVKHVSKIVRQNPNFLKSFDVIRRSPDLQHHIFVGDFRNVAGCHYYAAVDNVNVRFFNGMTPEANSLGVIKADIEMRRPLKDAQGNITGYKWVKKNTQGEPQTFFPSTWSKDEILEQCASAFSNPKKTLAIKPDGSTYSRMYVAESDIGVFIRWFEDNSGHPISFFPEW